jgi:hypothetical protein
MFNPIFKDGPVLKLAKAEFKTKVWGCDGAGNLVEVEIGTHTDPAHVELELHRRLRDRDEEIRHLRTLVQDMGQKIAVMAGVVPASEGLDYTGPVKAYEAAEAQHAARLVAEAPWR